MNFRTPLLLVTASLIGAGCTDRQGLETAWKRARDAEAERIQIAVKLADAERRADALLADNGPLRAKLAEADRQVAELTRKVAETAATEKESREKTEQELKSLKAHRDELTEWVEKELLPLAEAQDQRLVNLKNAAEQMAAEVEKVRKLPWKHPVMRRLVSREQVYNWNVRDLKKDLPEEEARKIVASGVEMGLVKPGTDLYQMLGSFMEAGVAAFYKPTTKTFYHVAGNDGRGAYPVVFHELVHAMEDQHYALDVMMKAPKKNSDAQLAVKGLVEGSASYYGEVYEKLYPEDRKAMLKSQANPEMMKKQAAMMQVVPTFFIAIMGLYPYNNAKTFVRDMGGADPANVDRLFADPPASTEQVLHPAKFKDPANRDYPRIVAKPDLSKILTQGWTELDDDNMGELMTGCLLATLQAKGNPQMALVAIAGADGGVLFKGKVKSAVEGWDGDRYSLWINGENQCCIVWTTVWDSEADAEEFASTYAPLLAQKVTGGKVDPLPSPFRVTEKGGSRVSGLERRGNVVCAVLGAPADKAEDCMKAALAVSITADPRDARDSK